MSAYLGRRGFNHLRARLSERDVAVVRSVREHRFLTARQIEQLHFADHATELAGARVCRRVLARLTRRSAVGSAPASRRRRARRFGLLRLRARARRQSPPGRGTVAASPSPRRSSSITRWPSPTRTSNSCGPHCGQLEVLSEVEVEPACWRRYTGSGGAPEILRPDLYVVTASGDFEDCWFLEIDRGTESPAAISAQVPRLRDLLAQRQRAAGARRVPARRLGRPGRGA